VQYLNRARIDDVATDLFILKRAMDPQSVEASLLNDEAFSSEGG
jgi:hypothetical protein